MCVAVFLAVSGLIVQADLMADVEDLSLPYNSYWNGSDLSGGFYSQSIFFHNHYNTTWFSWSGAAYSSVNDTNTVGWGNQYAVFSPGTGVGGTGAYVIVYDSWDADRIDLPGPSLVKGFYINNTTYAALDMLYGSGFSTNFGRATGDYPDWFLLTVSGVDRDGNETGTKEFYLADYRFTNNANDYIVSEWTWLALTNLGNQVKSLHFTLFSSDTGEWGMNTPAYFAMDELLIHPSYAPAAGQSNSTAIHMDSPAFVGWASGYTNYFVGTDCAAEWQVPTNALGKAQGNSYDIVSLGRGGEITLSFDGGIQDGPGADFAVFENSFSDTFLELGWVEVSSDGSHFFRFDNHSEVPAPVGGFGSLSTTNITGFAGKYKQGYGSPFDLAELAGVSSNLDISDVRYVKLVDIVGDGSATDTFGSVIYDPYPTSGSAGFDLDAIGVINSPSFHRITITADTNGVVTPDGGSAGYIHVGTGSNISFTMTPSAHHHIDDVLINSVSIGATNAYDFVNVQSSQTFEVWFTIDQFTISVSNNTYGSVTPGVAIVNYGENGYFTFSPDPWYTTDTVRIDGQPAAFTNGGMTVLSVTNDRQLEVLFGADTTSNNIPLGWLSYYGYTNYEADVMTDTDEDGYDAWQEFYAGTDPHNSTSQFSIVDAGVLSGTNYVIWVGGTNGSALPFTVYVSTNLMSGWTSVPGDVSRNSSGTNMWVQTNSYGDASTLLYRIGIQLP